MTQILAFRLTVSNIKYYTSQMCKVGVPQTRLGGRDPGQGFTFCCHVTLAHDDNKPHTASSQLAFSVELLLANLVDGVCGGLPKNGQVFNPYRAQSEPIYRALYLQSANFESKQGKLSIRRYWFAH